jgi:hypothetical protein
MIERRKYWWRRDGHKHWPFPWWMAAGLLLKAILAASAFSAKIEGPDACPPYRMARYSASDVGDRWVLWSVSPRGVADVETKEVGGHSTLFFTAPPGQYEIELLLIGKDRDTPPDRIYRTVSIGPTPGPNPPDPGPLPTPPGPSPQPPLPPGRFGLAVKARDWVNALQESDRKVAPAIANSFRSVAQEIANRNDDGVTWPAAEIEKRTAELNKAVLAGSGVNWKPFFDPLAVELTRLRLETMGAEMNSGYRDAWTELADGIQASVKAHKK